MKNKVYEVLFKDAKTLEVVKVKSDNMLDLCSSLKANGFKKRMEFKSNLSIIEACEMLHTLFPPKKKKNPVEGTLVGIDELIKPFSENKLFAKPPKLDKELSMGEVVSEIEKMANEAKIYIIKRQPTFFCKETKVSYNELKKFFTDKAINSMIEDGFIERNHSKYPIDFSKIIDKPKSFLDYHHEQIAKDIHEQCERIEKFTDDAIEKGLRGESGNGIFTQMKDEKGQPLTFWGGLADSIISTERLTPTEVIKKYRDVVSESELKGFEGAKI